MMRIRSPTSVCDTISLVVFAEASSQCGGLSKGGCLRPRGAPQRGRLRQWVGQPSVAAILWQSLQRDSLFNTCKYTSLKPLAPNSHISATPASRASCRLRCSVAGGTKISSGASASSNTPNAGMKRSAYASTPQRSIRASSSPGWLAPVVYRSSCSETIGYSDRSKCIATQRKNTGLSPISTCERQICTGAERCPSHSARKVRLRDLS